MIARTKGVTYSYPNAERPALEDVQFEAGDGELHLVVGPSGGGKSTLLRLFNGLIPQFHGGTLTGTLEVCGRDPSRVPTREMAALAGMVFQVPEDQAIADTVESEIAFGMEQMGVPRGEMKSRVGRLRREMGIDHLMARELATLSGGERQRVALAAVLALEPPLLLLDEPTSQLDGTGADAFACAVEAARTNRGTCVLVAEHRTARLFGLARAVWRVADGAVSRYGPADASLLAEAPSLARLGQRLALDPVPLSFEDWPAGIGLTVAPPAKRPAPGDELLSVHGLGVSYGTLRALDGVDLSVSEGEIVALVGANGSGKSTMFRAIAGLVKPTDGDVFFGGQPAPSDVSKRTLVAGYVPQDPTLAFYRESLAEEVGETLSRRHMDKAQASAVLDSWGLGGYAGRNPRDLSVGQQERAAQATMLAHRPRVWLLDEPTRGADVAARRQLACSLRRHAATGGAAIVATHDVESAAAWATRVVGLDGGRVSFDLPVREALGHGGPMPTAVARVVPGALLPEEVSRA